MSKQKQVVSDHKGLGVVRLLKGSKNYFMRFRFHDQKGWIPWRKTGTSDLPTASEKASDEYHLLRGRLGSDENMDVRKLYDDYTFVGAAKRWLEMYESKAKAGLSAGSGRRAASLAQHKAYKPFDVLPNLSSFISKACSGYGPVWTGLQTHSA